MFLIGQIENLFDNIIFFFNFLQMSAKGSNENREDYKEKQIIVQIQNIISVKMTSSF